MACEEGLSSSSSDVSSDDASDTEEPPRQRLPWESLRQRLAQRRPTLLSLESENLLDEADTAWDTEDEDEEEDELEEVASGTTETTLRRDVADVQKQAVRFHDMHRTFYQNFMLAAVTGFWVGFFSLPIISVPARLLFFGESDEKVQDVFESEVAHRWCNVSFNTTAINDSWCEEIEISDDEMAGTRGAGKHCALHPGRSYWGPIREFWIGNDKNDYFPIVANTEPVMVWNGTKDDFAEMCREKCETSARCARWTFWNENPGVGGRCYQFAADAPAIPTDWGWFGGACVEVHAHLVQCGSSDLGRMRNVAPVDSEPELKRWDRKTMTPWNDTDPGDIWCGILPTKYSQMWVNGAQMIVYTVYMNTGTTLRLAWQGIMGTFCAAVNLFVMKAVYPQGGKQRACSPEEQEAGVCREGDLVYEDSNYSPAVCLVDVLLVLALFLFSAAEENTIKFGMSWHIFFMMDFMNPSIGAVYGFHSLFGDRKWQWDDYKSSAFIMYFMGGVVAVLATLIPKPQLSMWRAFEGMKANANAINQVWTDSIRYHFGNHRSAMRFKIQTKLDCFPARIKAVETNLGSSWWELATGLINRRQRQIYNDIHHSMADLQEILYALRDSILSEDFGDGHAVFCALMQEPVLDLHEVKCKLLLECLLSPRNGKIAKRDRGVLLEGAARVHELQKVLLEAYNQAVPKISEHLADECVFAFAFAASARRIAELAERLASSNKGRSRARSGFWRVFCDLAKISLKGLWLTWAPSKIFRLPHLRFAARNFLSISVCFVIGIHGHSFAPSYLSPYSPTMANTLALLISRYKNSAWQKNMQRLLGVTFGKVIGILGSIWLTNFNCGSVALFIANYTMVWVFVTFFCYMYFTQTQWSSVACHIAAFGVVPLLDLCSEHVDSTFAMRYKEIGGITSALVVQFAVDMVFNRTSPGDLVVWEMKKISEVFKEAYHLYVHEQDMPALESSVQEMRMHLQEAWLLLPECDPKLRCLPVLDTPFKFDLCTVALSNLQALLSDLKLLLVAVADMKSVQAGSGSPVSLPTFSEPLRILFEQPALVEAREVQQKLLEDILDFLPLILAHNKETPIDDERFQLLLTRGSLDGTYEVRMRPLLYQQLDASRRTAELRMVQPVELTDDTSARLAVAVSAAKSVEVHLRVIHERCLKEDIY